jgi:hypothetical protein
MSHKTKLPSDYKVKQGLKVHTIKELRKYRSNLIKICIEKLWSIV